MGHKDELIKKLKLQISNLEKHRGSEDFKDDEWIALEERVAQVQGILLLMRKDEWSWARNWNCKYVNIRIDMRDGHAILCGQDGRISFEQLKYQWKSGDAEVEGV